MSVHHNKTKWAYSSGVERIGFPLYITYTPSACLHVFFRAPDIFVMQCQRLEPRPLNVIILNSTGVQI
jgi:hypothetical protein